MSLPNFPNITPTISLSTEQTIPLLLGSIALEEIALAHMINSEAEAIQNFLGTLEGGTAVSPPFITLSNFLALNSSVENNFRDNIMKEMLLEFKFRNILNLISTITPGPPVTTVTVTLGSDQTSVSPPGCPTQDNTATLSGQVLVNGSPAPVGTLVTFTLSDNTVAVVAPNPTTTDINGNFSAIFTATTPIPVGLVMVTATALGQNSNTVSISIEDCPGVSISLESSVVNLCALGTGTPITANLTGEVLVNGNPPPVGTLVTILTDDPTLGTIIPNPTPTNASGSFSTTFTVTTTTAPQTVSFQAFALGSASNIVTINIVDCGGGAGGEAGG